MKIVALTLIIASLASFAQAGLISDVVSIVETFGGTPNEKLSKMLFDPSVTCEDEKLLKLMNQDLSKSTRKLGCKLMRTLEKVPSVSQAAACSPAFFTSGPPGFFVCLGMSQQMANSLVEAANTCYHQCVAAGHVNRRGSASKISHSCKEFCVNN